MQLRQALAGRRGPSEMTTIEKLARAIEPELFADRDQVAADYPQYLPTYSRQGEIMDVFAKIRAVLTALLEPSAGVIDAGIDALDDCVDSDWDSGPDGEGSNSYTMIRSDAAATTFRAMIQHAMSELQA